MKKILLGVTTIAVVGLGSTFSSDSVQADTINDLHSKQSEISSERDEIKANLSKADAEIADVLFDLKELNEEISQIDEALKENQALMTETKEEISKSESEIALIEEEIAQLEEDIEKRYEILKTRITSYQKSGGEIGYLEVLFGSKDFNEFISRISAVTKITTSDAELMEKQEEDKANVETQKEKVDKRLTEQKEMKMELDEMQYIIKDQKEQNEDSKKELQKKEKQLKDLKTDLESQDNNLASLEAEIRQDIAAARSPVASNSGSSSSSDSDSNSNSNNSLTTLSSKKKNTTQPVASSGGGKSAAINAGYQFIGNSRYVYGARDPQNGRFDCSGFVNWAYAQAGYSLPRSTSGLVGVGSKVSPSNMQPGDLVFFDTNGRNGHVGIYIGGGKFIGSQGKSGVAVANMSSGYWKQYFSGTVRRVN